jgi:cell shape-determining protein MreC
MLYRQRTKNFQSFFSPRNVAVIVFVIMILLFVIVKPVSLIRMFQSAALSIYSAKQSLADRAGNIFSLAAAKENLADENRRLNEQRNAYLSYCSTTINSLRSVNLELQNSLGRKDVSIKSEVGTAFVIGKPPVVPYGVIVVDLGGKSGVKVGDLALVGDYIIGNIMDVSGNRSTVKLYGGKDEEMPLLVGDKRLPINGRGAGFGVYEAKITNIDSSIIGQNVRLIGEPDYLFGNIVSVEQPENGQYKNLIIESPVNVFEISMIDIVHNESK